jgi:hypothetical protein
MNVIKKGTIFIFCLFALSGFSCKKNSNSTPGTKKPDGEAPVTPAGKNPLGGICPSLIAWMSDEQLNTFLDEFDKSGAVYVRIDLPWSVIQPTNATSWDFSLYDRIIKAMVGRGIKLLVIPTYSPSWANGGFDDDKYPPTAEHATDWYNFVKACADRYIPLGVEAWEMWNEPNITGFWRPICNVENYTKIVLKNGANAVRSSAAVLKKHVIVVSGGLSPAATDGENIHPLDFLKGIYANGGKAYMDAIGHHPYCFPESPASMVEYSAFQMTPHLYQIMVDNGDGNKKIWGTEFGYHTGNASLGGVFVSKQAQYVALSYKLWHQWDYTGPLFWYDYQDLGTNHGDREQNFGLKYYDGTNKPGWDAYIKAMADNL